MRTRLTVSGVWSAVFLLAFFARIANASLFMFIPGIEGGSQDPRHPDWLNLTSLQLVFNGIDCTDMICSGENSLTTRFSMQVDIAYPLILNRQLRSIRIPEIIVEAFTEDLLIDQYKFEDVRFGDLSVTHAAGAPGQLVGYLQGVERLEVTHYSYDPGSPSATTTAWDFVSQRPAASAPVAGDYDREGDVDGVDYDVWRREFGFIMATIGASADGNADGLVDAADYTIWRHNLSVPVAASSVPEPNSAAMLGFVLLVAGRRRSRLSHFLGTPPAVSAYAK